MENKVNEIKNLLNKYIENSNSKIVVTKLNIPSFSPNGIFESKIEYGFYNMIEDFNKQLHKKLS